MLKLKTLGPIIGLLTFGLLISAIDQDSKEKMIEVQMVDHIDGDFSFADKWSYPENIFTSQPHGELVCDGWCPEGVIGMRLPDGRIDPSKKSKYYELVDTSHIYHSYSGTTTAYEYAGSKYAGCDKVEGGYIVWTEMNVGTHSALIMELRGKVCKAYINYNSIKAESTRRIPCTGGWLKVDQKGITNGKLKASFDLNFWDSINEKELSWEGLILTTIED